MLNSYPLIFIVGPTATGKTQVSYLLAKRINAEIVSCDSMLIYKEPDIITSKPEPSILGGVVHHFVNIISAEDVYSVFSYYKNARERILNLLEQDKPVIVCGGSGLYAKVLLDGIFEGPGQDMSLRKDLEDKAKKQGRDYLHNELAQIDPESAKSISSSDLRRIIRALEVYHLCGIPLSAKKREAVGFWQKLPIRIFGLRANRNDLYQRINIRVEEMFERGAVDEVKGLLNLNLSLTAKKIIGINEIEKFLSGKFTVEQATKKMQKNTRNFAKRQITWIKRDKRIKWIDIEGLSSEDVAEEIHRRITLLNK